MRRRVLLIGATGAFGSRLASMLAQVPELTLIVSSRSRQKAANLAAALSLGAKAEILPAAFRHGDGAEAHMRALEPWLVIDASGPFQNGSYGTARAAIQAGAHWIDLADAADYILGFPAALDVAAQSSGVFAVTGASSTPALSCAAVARITAGWQRIDSVETAIYPAGGGDVGRAVIDAVLSYAGSPVLVRRNGREEAVTGWGTGERIFIDGLGWRTRSPVATADYALMADLFGAVSVEFYAGLESSVEHWSLVALAKARRRGCLPQLGSLAPLLHRTRALTKPFSGTAGAMTVEARGVDKNANPCSARWQLLARDGSGPNVPVLAALALTKKAMRQTLGRGSSYAPRTLSLAEIEAEMQPYAISTQIAIEPQQRASGSIRTQQAATADLNSALKIGP